MLTRSNFKDSSKKSIPKNSVKLPRKKSTKSLRDLEKSRSASTLHSMPGTPSTLIVPGGMLLENETWGEISELPVQVFTEYDSEYSTKHVIDSILEPLCDFQSSEIFSELSLSGTLAGKRVNSSYTFPFNILSRS